MKIKIQLFITITLLYISMNMAFASPDGPEDITWRCAAYGGFNVLYCYLHSQGVKCRYNDLIYNKPLALQLTPVSVKTLISISCGYDVPLEARSLTPTQLCSLSLPLIAYMDGDSPDQGSFVLIMQMTNHDVVYMNGASATIQHMPFETFIRSWSGIALVGMPTMSAKVLHAGICFISSFVITYLLTALLLCLRRMCIAVNNHNNTTLSTR